MSLKTEKDYHNVLKTQYTNSFHWRRPLNSIRVTVQYEAMCN